MYIYIHIYMHIFIHVVLYIISDATHARLPPPLYFSCDSRQAECGEELSLEPADEDYICIYEHLFSYNL